VALRDENTMLTHWVLVPALKRAFTHCSSLEKHAFVLYFTHMSRKNAPCELQCQPELFKFTVQMLGVHG